MRKIQSTQPLLLLVVLTQVSAQTIPLPEHPRPDFERTQWQNLNGVWQFEFDSLDQGVTKKWNEGNSAFTHKITVPFPWGSQLSGVKDKADIAWYKRELTISPEWKNKRTFLTIGASDWETTVWLDGKLLGTHQGGYTPFSFELTEHLNYGQSQKLVVPRHAKQLLNLGTFSWLTPVLSVYKLSRTIKLDWFLKSLVLPNAYKKQC